MKSNKDIRYLLPAEDVDMGGFLVKQALPTQKVEHVGPFLLLHHARTIYSDNKLAKHQGVGPHPHRGFSPVTFVIEGDVHHRDSRNNNQIAIQGEVQWMHAGAGIVHSERPSQALVERKGTQEIIQLWINSPASKKMVPPEYIHLSNEIMPVFTSSEDNNISNKLIAGTYENLKGKVIPKSDMLIIWGISSEEGEQLLKIPKDFSTMLYLIKGEMNIKAYGLVEKENLVVFELEGDTIEMKLKANSQFLLLSGIPIDEKVTQYGPYVMNSQTEIMEAMRDYQMGKMGILIEE